jgi:hypothetical protein
MKDATISSRREMIHHRYAEYFVFKRPYYSSRVFVRPDLKYMTGNHPNDTGVFNRMESQITSRVKSHEFCASKTIEYIYIYAVMVSIYIYIYIYLALLVPGCTYFKNTHDIQCINIIFIMNFKLAHSCLCRYTCMILFA